MPVFVVTVCGIDSEATQGWSSAYRREVEVHAPSADVVLEGDAYTEILQEFLSEDLGAPVYAFDIESVRPAGALGVTAPVYLPQAFAPGGATPRRIDRREPSVDSNVSDPTPVDR